MKLRAPRPSDIPALAALETTLFPSDRLSPRQMRFHMDNPRAFFRVVAGAGGGAVGYVLVLYRGRAARLYSIALAPAAQGHGMGRRMMAAALRDAKRRGADKMTLEVRRRDRKVIALYQSFGFTARAVLPAYYGDGAEGLRMVTTF